MNQNYKNSYKVTEKELVSLSVYNVGFQKCDALYQWGPGIRDHYLIHPHTKALLEALLARLRDEGEDAVFAYIKKEILKK